VLYGLSLIDDKHKFMAINNDNSASGIEDNDSANLQGFDATGSVVEEAIAAEDSHIKYPEYISRLMNDVRAHPDNTTLQQEYKLIQRQIDFEYGDFPDICNIEDSSFDRSMFDVCNSKISFIYPTCQADPTINKEACDPNNHFINSYLKQFNPSILTDIPSREAYVQLNAALQIPAPSRK
jgi:hypothetical protein